MRCLIACLLFLGWIDSIGQEVYWRSVIIPGSEWRYRVPDSELPQNWTEAAYNDQTWDLGPSGIGYGDGDDETLIANTLSLFMRAQFELNSADTVHRLLLDIDFDDGFVAYLNGVEVARSFMEGTNPSFNQPASGFHEANLYRGQDPERFEIDTALLVDGANVVAIQVHNENINSSDLTSIPTLSISLSKNSDDYLPVPDWFEAPLEEINIPFESSNLPIVILETVNNADIPNEPKIGATMTIIEDKGAERNFLEDQDDPAKQDYSGSIQIEIRGSTSACCSPKKQYALTTYDTQGEKENVSLLGMPDENDWILNAFAFDPSLKRDYISYQTALSMGEYASRGRYVEVLLNGQYQGVYVLQEKLKVDKDRIDIRKLDSDDTSGDQLTGGYIIKADKTEGDDVAAWYMDNYAGWQTAFVQEFPNRDNILNQQAAYIQSYFFDLEREAGNDNMDIVDGYPSLIDIPSFVDFIILNEWASNPDAYQFSTFFHKDINGKLRGGPIWDFNLTFGNDLFQFGFDRSNTEGWQYDDNQNVGAMFWRDLATSDGFYCELSRRWQELRQVYGDLFDERVFARIDAVASLLAEAAPRDYARWGLTNDYDQHIQEIKDWIDQRAAWLDAQWSASAVVCPTPVIPQLVISKINYHPAGDLESEFFEITNASSEPIDLTGIYLGGTGVVYQFEAGRSLQGGQSLYLAEDIEDFSTVYGAVPHGEYSRGLDNKSEDIELLDAWGRQIDYVQYKDEAPWPEAADGEGFYLQLMDLNANNEDPTNWVASDAVITSVWDTSSFEFSIYPNPVNESLRLNAFEMFTYYQITDLAGKVHKQSEPIPANGMLDITNLSPGVYLLTCQDLDQRTHTSKFVVE
ncbi:MAG: CotH kinase family protein [Bacteroidota bacterium]